MRSSPIGRCSSARGAGTRPGGTRRGSSSPGSPGTPRAPRAASSSAILRPVRRRERFARARRGSSPLSCLRSPWKNEWPGSWPSRKWRRRMASPPRASPPSGFPPRGTWTLRKWSPTSGSRAKESSGFASAARSSFPPPPPAGEAAPGRALAAFQFAREKNGPRDARHQVTHLQLVTPSDVKRFASLAIIAVPQPFWFSKGGFYDAIEAPYLGEERASREYPMKRFFDAGVTVASASDFPVTIPFSPVVGMKMGITRSFDPANPEMVLGPEERVSLDQMIASFTRNGAFAARLEDRLGSLEVGKVGDVVVLDRNLFEVPTDQVGEAKVLLTLFEGREIYRAPGL